MIFKFRVWDKNNKEMIEWEELDLDKERGEDEITIFEPTGQFAHPIFFYDIMQTTGLKDILGNDIYEGDIVKVLVKDEDPKIMEDKIYTGIIVYEQGVFDVKTFDDTRLGIIPQMYMSDVDCVFRVLGNIYENKELLERDNDEEV